MQIIGDRVDGIEAKVKERGRWQGLKVNIALTSLKEREDGLLEFGYTYRVVYGDEEKAYIQIEGILIAREEDEERKKALLEEWEKNKRVPAEQAQGLLNAINYVCSAHGTIIARVLSYAPPLIPPRLRLGEKA